MKRDGAGGDGPERRDRKAMSDPLTVDFTTLPPHISPTLWLLQCLHPTQDARERERAGRSHPATLDEAWHQMLEAAIIIESSVQASSLADAVLDYRDQLTSLHNFPRLCTDFAQRLARSQPKVVLVGAPPAVSRAVGLLSAGGLVFGSRE